MKKKIICAVMTGVIAATCAAPAFACTPPIKVDMSWKKDLDRTIAEASKQAADKATANIVIPKETFDFVKDLVLPKEYLDELNIKR